MSKRKYETQPSAALLLDKKGKKFIQQVCGIFLFLVRHVDSTLLYPISAIASQSATPTKETMRQTHQLLDYIATQEDTLITYTSSDMKLAVHSNASDLNDLKAGNFSIQRSKNTPKQRRHYQYRTHDQTCHDIIDIIRTSSTINHGMQSRIHKNNLGKNGAQTAFNPITNRQRHDRCTMQRENTTKTKKRNRHVIPLAQRKRMPKQIQNILTIRQSKLCRLLDKTSSSNPPQTHKKKIPNPTHHIENSATRTATT